MTDHRMTENEAAESVSLDEQRPAPEKRYTKEEAANYLQEIASRLVSSEDAALHSMLALNQILRSPGIGDVLDDDLKEQARDLWLKIKSTGIHLNDPPMLFGLPKYDGNDVDVQEDAETA